MILPQLPTDNLYKFLFLSGLTIILASALLFLNQYNKIEDARDLIAIDIIKGDVDFLKDSLTFEIELDRLTTSEKYDSLELINLQRIKKGQLSSSEANRIREQIGNTSNMTFQMQKLIIERTASFNLHSNLTKHRLERQVSESKRLIAFVFISSTGVIIGLLLSYFGYQNWLTKIQLPMNRKIKKESEPA